MDPVTARALGRDPADQTDDPADEGADQAADKAPKRSAIRERLRSAEQEAKEAAPQADLTAQSDPLAEGNAEDAAADYIHDATPFDDDYEATFDESDYTEDEVSQFEYRAPFTTRRNPLRMWTAAAAIFALMALGTVAAVNFYGLPEWAPFNRPTFGIGKPDLVLNFAEAQQREETLENGVEIFRIRGSITNVGSQSVSVPQLVIVFKDTDGRAVFSKSIVPAKSALAPGESLNVVEGISGYPAGAETVGIGWAPG
ncbi:MAG: thioredoxin [Pseudomonadota bacterium]